MKKGWMLLTMLLGMSSVSTAQAASLSWTPYSVEDSALTTYSNMTLPSSMSYAYLWKNPTKTTMTLDGHVFSYVVPTWQDFWRWSGFANPGSNAKLLIITPKGLFQNGRLLLTMAQLQRDQQLGSRQTNWLDATQAGSPVIDLAGAPGVPLTAVYAAPYVYAIPGCFPSYTFMDQSQHVNVVTDSFVGEAKFPFSSTIDDDYLQSVPDGPSSIRSIVSFDNAMNAATLVNGLDPAVPSWNPPASLRANQFNVVLTFRDAKGTSLVDIVQPLHGPLQVIQEPYFTDSLGKINPLQPFVPGKGPYLSWKTFFSQVQQRNLQDHGLENWFLDETSTVLSSNPLFQAVVLSIADALGSNEGALFNARHPFMPPNANLSFHDPSLPAAKPLLQEAYDANLKATASASNEILKLVNETTAYNADGSINAGITQLNNLILQAWVQQEGVNLFNVVLPKGAKPPTLYTVASPPPASVWQQYGLSPASFGNSTPPPSGNGNYSALFSMP